VTASRSTALTFTSSGLFIRLGVVFAGDTAYGNHFSKVYECFEPTRLALLPIGACKPRWFMAREHMDHEEAIRAHLDLHSSESVAIHFDAFNSAQDSYEDSVKRLESGTERTFRECGWFLDSAARTDGLTTVDRCRAVVLNLEKRARLSGDVPGSD
jgi:L-ascorbate metabolism protein UlaG (beta-lactamase superfamily)